MFTYVRWKYPMNIVRFYIRENNFNFSSILGTSVRELFIGKKSENFVLRIISKKLYASTCCIIQTMYE